jgi:hypothetical protein
MTTDINASGAQPPAGSAGGGNDSGIPPAQKPEDVVPYDKFRGLLDEKKKAQKRAEEAEAKLAQIEEDKLRAAGEINKLLEAEKERNRIISEELENHKNVQKNARKLNAFIKSAGGSLDEKWFGLVDLNSISFKEGTDEVDPMTVMSQVENFKKTWPEAFKQVGMMPPATPPNGMGGKISRADFLKLKAKDMAKYKASDILD